MKHSGDPGLPERHDPCPCPPPTPRNGDPHARIHRRASVSVSHTGASGNARRRSCVSGHVRRSRRVAPRPSPEAGGPPCGRGPGPRRRRRRDPRTAFGPTAFMSCLTCGMPCRYPRRASKPEGKTGPLPASFPTVANGTRRGRLRDRAPSRSAAPSPAEARRVPKGMPGRRPPARPHRPVETGRPVAGARPSRRYL